VEFVHDEELQSLTVIHHSPVHILIAGKDQFQHHEVGEQDVRWVFGQGLSFGLTFLPGIARNSEPAAVRPHILHELPNLLRLAVGKGIHRVDDDGSGAGSGVVLTGSEDAIDDRDEERE